MVEIRNEFRSARPSVVALAGHIESIAKIRDRTRGIGNEFVLACDMRFASRQSALFGNPFIPAAVSVFPGENYQAPRSWTARAYDKLIYYNKVDKGGHYAAWEQPQLFSEEDEYLGFTLV